MTDFARLVLAVDSTGLVKGEAALRDLGTQAQRTGAAADAAGDRMRGMGVAAGAAAGAQVKLGRSTQLAAGATGNLVAQLNDIGMMLAAGQNPLQLAIQQGTQITQVIGPMGAAGAVRALGTAFMGMLSPINLVTIGAIAAGGAIVGWLTSARDEAVTLDEAIGRIDDSIEALNDATSRSLEDLREKYGAVTAEVEALLAAQERLAQAQAIRDAATALGALRDQLGDGFFATSVGDAAEIFETIPRFAALYVAELEEISRLDSFAAQADALADLRSQLEVTAGGIDGMTDKQYAFWRSLVTTEDAFRRLAQASEQADMAGSIDRASDSAGRLSGALRTVADYATDAQVAVANLAGVEPGAGWLSNAIFNASSLANQLWNGVKAMEAYRFAAASAPAMGGPGTFPASGLPGAPEVGPGGARPEAGDLIGLTEQRAAVINAQQAISRYRVEVDALADSMGGGGGGGGAAGAARDLRGEFDDLMATLDPAVAAMRDMQKATALADDALAAGVITAAEHAAAIDQIGQKYADAGPGAGSWSDAMTEGIETVGAALKDMIDSGEVDFDAFADTIVDAFSGAVSKMVAEAASAQLGKAFGGMGGLGGVLGGLAGPIGGFLGGLAGGLLGGLFGGNRRRREQREREQQAFEDERSGLRARLFDLQGKTAKLRQLELRALAPANRAMQKRIWQLEDEAKVTEERSILRQQLLALQGKEAKLRRLELRALDPANRAMQKRIWQLEDEAKVTEERSGLRQQLLALQGKEAKLRQLELRELAPANRELQRRIWALQDEQEIANERSGLQEQWLQLVGDTNALRELELEKLDASNRALQLQIWAEEDRQRAVEETTRAIEEAVAAIDPQDFASLFEYERALALARNGLAFGNLNSAPSVAPAFVPPAPVSGTGTATGGASGSNDAAVIELKAIRSIQASVLSRVTQMETKIRKWDADGLPAVRA